MIDSMDWADRAICATIGGDLFFPEKGEPVGTAKRVCNGTKWRKACPVRDDCLAYALRNDIRHGVFGGMSPSEREILRQARERVA